MTNSFAEENVKGSKKIVALSPSSKNASKNSDDKSPMHWTGDKQVWDRKTNFIELFGHAAVHQPGESIFGDYISIDMNTRLLDAKGNCIYIASDSIIYSDEMHFSLDTRTGTIVRGRIVNDSFTLTGERINKLGKSRFQTHNAEYTTCIDCPSSWTFFGKDVDLELEGYAFMSGVTTKVKEAPVFWLPYIIIPLKTRRQTGLLFPKFGLTQEGFRYVQPFFWATSKNTDMTFSFGVWQNRGKRFEWEGRYQLTPRSGGVLGFWYLHDDVFNTYLETHGFKRLFQKDASPHRYAFDIQQTQLFGLGIEEKLKLSEVSDNLYHGTVAQDVKGKGEGYMTSTFSLSRPSSGLSTYVVARRYRSLITQNPVSFDPRIVQVTPQALVTTNDRVLFGSPLVAGLTLGVSNFGRTGGPFDDNKYLVVDQFRPDKIIRRTTRVSLTPTLYTTLRPLDVISVIPSFEYRAFFYDFYEHQPSLERGYLLFRNDISTQFERIYDTDDPNIPRIKHLFRPQMTYNAIPLIQEGTAPDGTRHPFLKQIDYARRNGFTGFQFDNYDIVPRDTSRTYSNYFVPLGNSMSYGFTTQWIRRRGSLVSLDPIYQRVAEWKAGQTYNFLELRNKQEDRQPLSRFFSSALFEFDQWGGNVDYTYVPYAPISESRSRHIWSTGARYTWIKTLRQRIMTFERSITLGYSYNKVGGETNNLRGGLNYSINDYVLPTVGLSYDLIKERILGIDSAVRFQAPSQCWKLDLTYKRTICTDINGNGNVCPVWGIDFALNFTGGGYGTFGELASTTTQGGSK